MKTSNRRGATMGRRLLQTSIAMFVWLMASPPLAYAHGGMAGEDVRRPMGVAATVAITSYFVVLHWPRRRKVNAEPPGSFSKTGAGRQQNAFNRSHALKPVPHLKAVPRS